MAASLSLYEAEEEAGHEAGSFALNLEAFGKNRDLIRSVGLHCCIA